MRNLEEYLKNGKSKSSKEEKEENDALDFYAEVLEVDTAEELFEKLNSILKAPINIDDIYGAGIGMCTERAILTQNICSFLGYNIYLMSGKIQNEGEDEFTPHSWNVIEQDGIYKIFDTAQSVLGETIENVNSIEDLLKGKNITVENKSGQQIIYQVSITKESELQKLAKEGAKYRYDATKYLKRLEMYREIRGISKIEK